MQRFVQDLKLLNWTALGCLIGALLLAAIGVIPSPIIPRFSSFVGGILLTLFGPFGTIIAVLYVFSGLARRSLPFVVAGGLLAAAAVRLIAPVSAHLGDDILRHVFFWSGGIGCAAFVDLLRRHLNDELQAPPLVRVCLGSVGFLLLFELMGTSYLELGRTLHPLTFDIYAHRVDTALFGSLTGTIISLETTHKLFSQVIAFVYESLPAWLVFSYAIQIARADRAPSNMLLIIAISVLASLFVYNLLPVAGPRFSFPETFPHYLPDPADLNLVLWPSDGMRNGIPSMHFGWALLFWINARLMRLQALRYLFAVYAVLMVVATVGTGQHFLVDLIPSFPFVLFIQALGSNRLAWNDRDRRSGIVVGLAGTLAWIAAIRFFTPLLESYPLIGMGLAVLTTAAAIVTYLRLERRLLDVSSESGVETVPSATQGMESRGARILTAMFFFSGFAGLIYEVVFSKSLALTFGSTALATYTVLATYMGGMAIGAWIGGIYADRARSPLFSYALCEGGIGLYALATPYITDLVQYVYVSMAGGLPPDSPQLTALRLGLGMVVMLIPTILMGITLPLLVTHARKKELLPVGGAIGKLYSANTLGAAAGALLAGYLIIPLAGVMGTLVLAVLLNLLVALAAVDLWKHPKVNVAEGAQAGAEEPPALDAATIEPVPGAVRLTALLVLLVGGIGTLAIEVLYIQLLAVVAGNSTYAFSLMLFTFLVGLGAGAAAGKRWSAMPAGRQLWLIGVLQCTLGLVVWLSLFFWAEIPEYFASFGHLSAPLPFGAREFVRGLVCFLVMVPPAFLIGMCYPLAIDLVGRSSRDSRAVGGAVGLNTVGNIIGVLATGFLLVPALGSLKTTILLGAVALTMGCVVYLAGRSYKSLGVTAVAVVLVFLSLPSEFNYTSLASGTNVYFRPQSWGAAIDHVESIDGGLTSVHVGEFSNGTKVKTLLTNGKFQGNDAMGGEMVAQAGFSAVPMLHTDKRDSALIIGYGTGVAARIMAASGFKQVDVAELSKDILDMSERHFGVVNGNVLSRPNVKAYVTDGRNFLLVGDKKYDVIGLEISSIWFAGAASLYNREFYQIAKKRLNPGGVVQQWIQLHHILNEDVLRIIASIRSEFPYVWLHVVGGQGVLIASDVDSSADIAKNLEALKKGEYFSSFGEEFTRTFFSSVGTPLLDPNAVDRLFKRQGITPQQIASTDNNVKLEYSTPRGNALPDSDIRKTVHFLVTHAQ